MSFRDKQNRRLTKSLFIEHDKELAMYTLKDSDVSLNGIVYPSLYRLYLELSDPTEYLFATTFFESLEHWNMVVDSYFFKEYIARWRTELELKLKAEAFQAILKEAKTGKYDAHKFLATKGWVDKSQDPKRRGRPSKQEIDQNARELAFLNSDIEEDLRRIRTTDIN